MLEAKRYQDRHAYVWQHGESLVELLDPRPGERILDLGCGPGQLTTRIASAGAAVIGIDRSPEMIGLARENFPEIDFRVADAAEFEIEEPVDAVFSNAVLHWVKDADGTAACVWRALKPGGRFVAELGGKGNTRSILAAIREVYPNAEFPWNFPSVAEYTTVLERHGFEIRLATLFDRPTRAEGENGLEDWLVTFGGLSEAPRRAVVDRLRPGMYRDGAWILDYKRLRVVGVRTDD